MGYEGDRTNCAPAMGMANIMLTPFIGASHSMSATPEASLAAVEPEVWLKSFKPQLKRQLNMAVALGLGSGLLLVGQAALLAWVINAGAMRHAQLAALWPWLAALLPIFVVRFALVQASERVAFKAGAQLRQDLRARLLAHVQRLGPVWIAGKSRGDLLNSVVNGVEALEGYYARYVPTMNITGLAPLMILIAVFPVDWISGTVLLITGPLIPLFMWLIGKGTEELNQRQWRKLAYLSGRLLDTLQGLTTLKLFGASKREADVVAQISENYRTSTMQVLRVAFLSSVVLEFLATAGIALVAVLIGFRLLWGELHFLPGFFVLLLAPEFYAPLRNMGAVYHLRMDAIGASERILEILAEPLPARRNGLASLPRVAHTIRFDEVFVSYDGKHEALAGCSFEIPANSVTAVVGASGTGKSTALNVLLGFVRAQRGRIVVSGVDLAEVSEDAWLGQLAWVAQRAHVFAGSVADNIRLAKPDASLEAIVACARAAHADAFIRALPHGYDTMLGERGAGLSGGQVQRLALARAFLKDAPVLVLDEPTAHLDARSQREVMDSLAVLARGRTVLMLTHRLHTLALADHVVVLDAGRVVDAGPRDRLAHAGGAFARMLQTGAEVA